MPVPPAVTSLVLSKPEGDNSPSTQLNFNHNGTDLDRFEVLYNDPELNVWESFEIYPKADLLVSGTSYEVEVDGDDDFEFTVRAIDSTGLVSSSASNPTVTRSGKVKGVHLRPWKRGKLYNGTGGRSDLRVFIRADDVSVTRPIEGSVFASPYRRGKIVVIGAEHMAEGTITGKLGPGFNGATAMMQKRRLKRLLRRQANFRISLWTPTMRLYRVSFPEGHTLTEIMAPEHYFQVQMNYVQIAEAPND